MSQVTTLSSRIELDASPAPYARRVYANNPKPAVAPKRTFWLTGRFTAILASGVATVLCLLARPLSDHDLPDSDPAFRRPKHR